MVGFKELLRRLQIQEQMTKQHQTRVDVSENTHAVVFCQFTKSKEKNWIWAQCLFDYQQWNFETDFVVSRTEYTDVQFMLAASRTAASLLF